MYNIIVVTISTLKIKNRIALGRFSKIQNRNIYRK